MKIKFGSDGNLLFGKLLNIPSLIIISRSAFQEDNIYYSQVYFYECLYKFVKKL